MNTSIEILIYKHSISKEASGIIIEIYYAHDKNS